MSEIKDEKDPCAETFPAPVKTGPEVCGYCGEASFYHPYSGYTAMHQSVRDCFMALKQKALRSEALLADTMKRVYALENPKEAAAEAKKTRTGRFFS